MKVMEALQKKIPPDSPLGSFLRMLESGEKIMNVSGLPGSAKAFLFSQAFAAGRSVVVACPTLDEAERLARDLSLFMDPDKVVLYPPWDILSFDILASQRDTETGRISALCRLALGEKAVYIATTASLLQRAVPESVVRSCIRTVSIGDTLERDGFTGFLEEAGYGRVPMVEEQGEYSVRGQVVDVFTPAAPNPFRLVLMGDEIESIRTFDPVSQRSLKELAEFTLTPARELIRRAETRRRAVRNITMRANDLGLPRSVREKLIEIVDNGFGGSINPLFMSMFYINEGNGSESIGLSAFSSYVPRDAVVFFYDSGDIARSRERIETDVRRAVEKAQREGKFHLDMDHLLAPDREGPEAFERMQTVRIDELELGTGGPAIPVRFDMESVTGLKRTAPVQDRDEGIVPQLAERIRGWIDGGDLVACICTGEESLQRMIHLLEGYDIPATRAEGPLAAGKIAGSPDRGRGRLVLKDGKLSSGFRSRSLGLVVFSDEEIFGKKVKRRRVRAARESFFLRSFGELKEGDPVVHTEHGIGVYRGLEKISIADIENDYLILEYLDGDKLYIPVDRMDQVQRYIGPEGHVPRPDKLGGTAWENAKKKVRKEVEAIAEELVSLYAAREVMERNPFHPLDKYYEEFASAFEYEETPDQARAIEEINGDMDQAKPMDRLVCGDAGFGKTEVAVRAAFRAAMEGRQVAVLVPTTILAEQHFQTFSHRLEDHPVRAEVINRFRSRAEQKKILEDLKEGKVDILIGTHRLLQKDIEFRNLGLVIIDEEQKFGVTHKEKLKKLRTLVDVLTLTATPIPRTLELSLVGIRDLSVINTPPRDRREIRTVLIEFDRDAIRDTIRFELGRGGQVFFVHNRINSMRGVVKLVRELVPEAKVVSAHGQMPPRELEDVMIKFIRGDYNVLVATSIIGSGIDIANANTMIINRADRFGLSQLYQLRGRVGRSNAEAYAYLIIPDGASLSADARKRLQAIRDFTEPGSGFKIAAQDLEIRGAGNLLGSSQSGHIAAVGYELYIELMEKTIRELKGGAADREEIRPEIRLGIPAFIPEEYIPDMSRRLTLYKRISLAETREEIEAIREELADTCGSVDSRVENLLEVIGIRNTLKAIRVKRMEYDGRRMLLAFQKDSVVDPARIMSMVRADSRARLTPDLTLTLSAPAPGAGVIQEAKDLLERLVH
ncbi:MAG TPA: transcription-repair coupling factor [Syntrophales bacterium]|nr:transcription-repair coupling factor [Syntrophales bacterium]